MSTESAGIDPYEAVLADLRAKRDQLDEAISAIESVRGGTPNQTYTIGATAASGSTVSPGEGPGAYLGKSIVEATKMLLTSKRQALRTPDITAALLAGGLVLNSKDPGNTIGSVLTRRSIDVGDIVRVGRGLWGLKDWYPNRNFRKEAKADNGGAEKPEAEEATPEGELTVA